LSGVPLAGTADTLSRLHKEHASPPSFYHYFPQKSVIKVYAKIKSQNNTKLQTEVSQYTVKLITSTLSFGAGGADCYRRIHSL